MTDEEKVTEKKNKVQPEENIERLKKIRQKRTSGVSMKYMAGAGAAVAVVIVVAVAGGVLGKSGESRAGRIKVETVEASLETTAPPETSGEPASIVLETTLSAEEIAEKEHDEAVQKVLDGYANLGIAGVSGYLNVRKIPETYGEVVGKLLSGGACEIIDTSTDGWYKISSGGVTGYVSSQYIYTGDKAREVAAENVIERAVVSTDKLNVRKEPSQDSEIMGQVYKDERYPVESIQDGWVQIDDGYLSADYVTVRYALNEARKQDMRTTVLSLYENLGVSNVSNYLNVRDKASERDGKIIAKLPSNAGCDILETTDDGWYKIRSGKITGYVKSEYILTGQQAEDKAMQVAKLMAIANTDGVNVRSEPNTESRIWTQIASSEKFLVVSQQDGWVEIELDDSTAFISSDYVDVKYGLNEAIPYTPVVEAPAKGTGSSKPSGGTTSKPGKAEAPMMEAPAPMREAFPRNGLRSPTMLYSLWAILTYGEARALQTARTALVSPCLSWPISECPCPTALRLRRAAENPSNPARCGLEIWYSIPAAAAGSTMWPFISATARWSMPPVNGRGSRSLPGITGAHQRSSTFWETNAAAAGFLRRRSPAGAGLWFPGCGMEKPAPFLRLSHMIKYNLK